ncbi:uncharacterized protein LOC101863826 [Aplysia californica]|uniref:Uncharacterized protein LOC101863826 n=1 Tax=Aplysia californica TaxID=6500 RepID=A0ABM0JUF1_APLCA|nr:uncharacterized protein LOC101863826 [Aplysia californica]
MTDTKQLMLGLDKLCHFFPGSLRPKCENLVQQRGSDLVQLLQHIPKDLLCTLVCRSNNAETRSRVPEEAEQEQGPVPEEARRGLQACFLCKVAVKTLDVVLDKLLEDDVPEEKIADALSNGCRKIPKFLRPTCRKIARPENVGLLLSLPSKAVCRKIRLCRF